MSMGGSGSERRAGATALWLLLAMALAFLLRAPGLPAKLGETPIRFIGPDPYYHLRRAELAVNHFPRIPGFDHYIGYPRGGNGGWPPLFELITAAPALAIGLGQPSPQLLERCAALLPPLLGSLTVLLVYLLGVQLAGRACGLLSAFALALLPAHAFKSAIGYFDHDVAAVFFAAAFFAFLVRAETAPPGKGRSPALLAGGALALGMLSWTGFTLFAGIAAAYAALRYAGLHRRGQDDQPLLAATRTAFACAGLAILPFAPVNLPDFGPLSFAALTFFQPLLFLGLALVAGLLGGIARRVPPGHPAYRRLPLRILLALAGAAAAVALLAPGFAAQAWKGLVFLGGRDPWLRHIPEFEPLWVTAGRFDPGYAAAMLGGLVFLWPLALPLLAGREADERRGPARLLMGTSLVLLFILTSFENRHSVALALPLALLYGFLGDHAWRSARRLPARRKAAGLALAAGLAALLWPALRFHPLPDRRTDPQAQQAFLWLRDHTPPTSFYGEPEKVPEYGVLAPPEWYGHHLVYLARRPALGTPFGHFVHGFREAAEFYLSGGEREAVEVLERNRTRYLVLTEQLACFEIYTDLLGRDARRYLAPGGDGRRTVLRPAYFDLVQNRLYFRDGLDRRGQSLRRFRLIWESPGQIAIGAGRVPVFRIAECVRGARLVGRGADGETVRVALPITTGGNRRFLFSAGETVRGGRFQVVVPYATGRNGETLAGAAYEVLIGDRPPLRVPVSEAQVLSGATVRADGAY